MNYIQVKPEHDGKIIKNHSLVAHELLTQLEASRLFNTEHSNFYEVIDIPPKKTYYSFGVRFAARSTGFRYGNQLTQHFKNS